MIPFAIITSILWAICLVILTHKCINCIGNCTRKQFKQRVYVLCSLIIIVTALHVWNLLRINARLHAPHVEMMNTSC